MEEEDGDGTPITVGPKTGLDPGGRFLELLRRSFWLPDVETRVAILPRDKVANEGGVWAFIWACCASIAEGGGEAIGLVGIELLGEAVQVLDLMIRGPEEVVGPPDPEGGVVPGGGRLGLLCNELDIGVPTGEVMLDDRVIVRGAPFGDEDEAVAFIISISDGFELGEKSKAVS